MNSLRSLFLIIFLSFLSVVSLSANESAKDDVPVKAELVAKELSVQPGQSFLVGVKLDMSKGWDTYWINPGDSGFPTQVKWDLPPGFTAGPLKWPYPERFNNDSLVAFGYTGSTLLLTEITAPEGLKEGTKITLAADVNWLACSDSCVPGSAHLTLDLPVSQATPLVNEAMASAFTRTEGLLPKTAEEHSTDLAIQMRDELIALHLKPKQEGFGDIEELTFIPEEGQMIDYNAPQTFTKTEDGGFILNVQRLDPSQKAPDKIKGVLLVSEKGSDIKRIIQVDNSSGGMTHFGSTEIWIAISFAFLGGIILNVMPCVLPVIALKIFSFVKMAGQKPIHIIKHGLVFSVGVVLSFWVLSGILLVLRAYGQGVGWGFQLQEPVFVAILASILFILGLSLFGLFEMGTSLISLGSKSEGKSPLMGSFMSGILATVVATPCTGPLLGPAVGFAMTLPAMKALMIFTFVGLGMAFPYLFFSFFPKLVRFLPKPGNWMVVFKQLMGFVMMVTVLWLLWVFSAQTDMVALFALLAAFVVMSVAAWIYGRWATPLKSKMTRRFVTFIAICMIGCSSFYALQVARHSSNLIVEAQSGDTQYSAEKVRSLREEGKTVFVDFTAKWCLICQANKVVLHSAEVQKFFAEKNVVFMEADWTKRDSAITKELERLGRSGVPVYALYPANTEQGPVILPQTLTAQVVVDYVARLNSPQTIVQK